MDLTKDFSPSLILPASSGGIRLWNMCTMLWTSALFRLSIPLTIYHLTLGISWRPHELQTWHTQVHVGAHTHACTQMHTPPKHTRHHSCHPSTTQTPPLNSIASDVFGSKHVCLTIYHLEWPVYYRTLIYKEECVHVCVCACLCALALRMNNFVFFSDRRLCIFFWES